MINIYDQNNIINRFNKMLVDRNIEMNSSFINKIISTIYTAISLANKQDSTIKFTSSKNITNRNKYLFILRNRKTPDKRNVSSNIYLYFNDNIIKIETYNIGPRYDAINKHFQIVWHTLNIICDDIINKNLSTDDVINYTFI